jgi:hypothetical protein
MIKISAIYVKKKYEKYHLQFILSYYGTPFIYFINGSRWKAEIIAIERSDRVLIVIKMQLFSWLLWLRRAFSKP